MSQIRISVVEDDGAYARELHRLFQHLSEYEWAGAFGNPVPFLAELPRLDADVILFDIDMPRMSGLECIREIREFLPAARVLMLTVRDDEDVILKAFLEGADGYLLKESTPKEICAAIHESLQGGAPMTSRIARKVIRLLGQLETRNQKIEEVSPRSSKQ